MSAVAALPPPTRASRKPRAPQPSEAAEPLSEEQLRRVAMSHNLTDQQYDGIARLLRRQPTVTEVGMFGVMYSEHCSYGSSKVHLKTFPTTGKRVLVAAGKENAGLIDIGGGLGVAFKVESHNHPSAVEPHAGAATGVGGIIRDIFTMGARPIALLDSLRFGPLNGARTKFLLQGVVKGISDYGNSVGIPTVAGEIYFDETYRENPLVNAMCIGIVPAKQIAYARAAGVGNPVLYVGSSTGRDGLGGASFASREITEGSEADRPAVQIGDPFTEKCLIEATLEALATGDVVGIQDMGAAGLTCSTCEMASRGRVGIEIDVALVPRREEGMTPYEVMLSESQERMLLVVKRGRTEAIRQVFTTWGLHAVEIGRVTGDGKVRIRDRGEVVAEIPARALADDAPVYRRPMKRPAYLSTAQALPLRTVAQPKDYNTALLKLLGSPTIADKAYVYEQYDHMVQTNTVVLPGRADAAVLRIKETGALLATTIDGTGAFCYLDPYDGGRLAVAEAARNLACVGATPLAVTDCLNFGNPHDPEIMWQFAQCVRGISDACRAFGTPVTGGNVSLYNESPRGAIDPTPVIGMIGLIEGGAAPVTANFKQEGDVILLLGQTREELGGSEYLKLIHRQKRGLPPRVDLAAERRLIRWLVDAAAQRLLQSAHDCAEGGLAVAVAECCVIDKERLIGATIRPQSTVHPGPTPRPAEDARRGGRTKAGAGSPRNMRTDALLFGESSGRAVVSCRPEHQARLEALARQAKVPAAVVGRVGGDHLRLEPWCDVAISDVNHTWRYALEQAIAG